MYKPARRMGDAVAITGSYQHDAAHSRNPIQRFWHLSKQMTIREMMCPAIGDVVIDAGCGSGVISGFLGSLGATVVGVDANPEAIAFAWSHYGSDGVSFRQEYVDDQFQMTEPVDKIYCLEVIEHIHPFQALDMLRQFHRILKPDGLLFLTTPNYASLWPVIEWCLDKFTNAARLKGDQHVTKYTPSTLMETCASAGFRVSRTATFCGIAPWCAAVSFGFATRLHALEIHSGIMAGSIIACVLQKMDTHCAAPMEGYAVRQ